MYICWYWRIRFPIHVASILYVDFFKDYIYLYMRLVYICAYMDLNICQFIHIYLNWMFVHVCVYTQQFCWALYADSNQAKPSQAVSKSGLREASVLEKFLSRGRACLTEEPVQQKSPSNPQDKLLNVLYPYHLDSHTHTLGRNQGDRQRERDRERERARESAAVYVAVRPSTFLISYPPPKPWTPEPWTAASVDSAPKWDFRASGFWGLGFVV